jgi:hypothetical protein
VAGGAGARSGESTPDFGGFGQGTQLEEKDFEEHARGRSVSPGVSAVSRRGSCIVELVRADHPLVASWIRTRTCLPD